MKPGSSRHRLFIALAPPAGLRTAAAAVAAKFAGEEALAWVSAQQLHLTLRFLGETDAITLAALRGALRQLQFAPFRLVTAGVGFFPDERNASVFWVGINHDERLLAFKGQLDQLLAAQGFPRDNRRFTPHLTVARIRAPLAPALIRRLLDQEPRLAGHGVMVGGFGLYSSELTPGGAVHTLEEEYPAAKV